MKTFNLLLLFCIPFTFCKISNAQIIDNYGVRLGINQSYIQTENLYGEGYGFYGFINAEKKLLSFLSFKPEVGYIFNNYNAVYPGYPSYVTHNLALNLNFKIHPFRTKVKPYLILGLQGSYFLGHNSRWNEKDRLLFPSLIKNIDDTFDSSNKFLLSGVIGLGIEFNNYLYLDLEYYPTFAKIYKEKDIAVNGIYLGVTFGLNISNFFTKK